jgi:hypothetical protein
MPWRDTLLDELEIPADVHQWISDLMRKTRREFAHRNEAEKVAQVVCRNICFHLSFFFNRSIFDDDCRYRCIAHELLEMFGGKCSWFG